jgi:hypothetical protein
MFAAGCQRESRATPLGIAVIRQTFHIEAPNLKKTVIMIDVPQSTSAAQRDCRVFQYLSARFATER